MKLPKKWYKSGNEALRSLALEVFPDKNFDLPEVREIINEILDNVDLYALTETQLIQIRALHNRKNDNISSNKLLRVLSIYYNKGWKKTYYNSGYFISKNPLKEEWTTVEHKCVYYPGIAYFKEVNDAFKAIKILCKTKLEDLYTDL